jgi:hypothetical protein
MKIPVITNDTIGIIDNAPYPNDTDDVYKHIAMETVPSKIILIGSFIRINNIININWITMRIRIIVCECKVFTVNDPINSEEFVELYNFNWCFSSGLMSVK